MLTETKAHIRYFEKKLNKLDYALRRAGEREKQIQEIRETMKHYRAAIRAMAAMEAMNRKDGWEAGRSKADCTQRSF